MKQTTGHDGLASKKSDDCYDFGWISLKQTTGHDECTSIKPNDWSNDGRSWTEQTTNQSGCIAIKPFERHDQGCLSVKLGNDLVGWVTKKVKKNNVLLEEYRQKQLNSSHTHKFLKCSRMNIHETIERSW